MADVNFSAVWQIEDYANHVTSSLSSPCWFVEHTDYQDILWRLALYPRDPAGSQLGAGYASVDVIPHRNSSDRDFRCVWAEWKISLVKEDGTVVDGCSCDLTEYLWHKADENEAFRSSGFRSVVPFHVLCKAMRPDGSLCLRFEVDYRRREEFAYLRSYFRSLYEETEEGTLSNV